MTFVILSLPSKVSATAIQDDNVNGEAFDLMDAFRLSFSCEKNEILLINLRLWFPFDSSSSPSSLAVCTSFATNGDSLKVPLYLDPSLNSLSFVVLQSSFSSSSSKSASTEEDGVKKAS